MPRNKSNKSKQVKRPRNPPKRQPVSDTAPLPTGPPDDAPNHGLLRRRLIITVAGVGVLLAASATWFSVQRFRARSWAAAAQQALSERNFQRADACYQKADSLDYNAGRYRVGRARVARLRGDLQRSREIMQTIPRIGDDAAGVSRELTLLEAQDGRAPQLLDQFDRLKTQRPDDADAVFQAYVEGFDVADQREMARQLAFQWLEENSANPFAHLKVADFAYDADDPDASRKHYESALRLQPHLTSAWQGLSRIHADNFEYAKALKCSERVLTLDANNVEAKMRRGSCLNRLHQIPEAIAELESLLEIAPQHFAARYALVQLLIQQDQPARSIELMEQFFPEFEQDVSINYLMANAHQQLGDHDDAARFLQKHLDAREAVKQLEVEAFVTPPEQQDFEFCKSIGLRYLTYSWDAAFEWLQRANMLKPVDPTIQQALGDFSRKRGDTELAQKYYRQADQLRQYLQGTPPVNR